MCVCVWVVRPLPANMAKLVIADVCTLLATKWGLFCNNDDAHTIHTLAV